MTLRHLRRPASLASLGLAFAVAPAMAGDPLDLLRADPANRSGEREVSRAIVRMVAERSDSPAVRARASTDVPWGRIAVGPDEVLAEIGAVAALGGPRAVPSIIQPPAPPPASPAAATASPPRPAPIGRAEPAAAQPAVTEPRARRYLGIFVKPEPVERGGDGGGGGGGGGGGW